VIKNLVINAEFFFRRKMRKYFLSKDIKRLEKKDFVIISNNCFGGQAYVNLELQYNTPFAGVFMYGPCYLKMLKNFSYYMEQKLVFVEKSIYKGEGKVYPIAKLDDVEVHFLHYPTKEEAAEKWYRRKERMLKVTNFDNYYFEISDRDGVDSTIIKEFHKLDFKNKISFAAKPISGLSPNEHISVFNDFNQHKSQTPNGKKMFKISFLYLDFVHWINKGEVKRTRFKG
jgi:uncharacterized protein (DUF1919 family)